MAEVIIQEICTCGQRFTLSIGEQRFFKQKGWTLPKRCAACRAKRRDEEKFEKHQAQVRAASPFKEFLPPSRQIKKIQKEIFG